MSDAINNTDPDIDVPCPIVAIGASAGGLEALQQLFEAAPTGHGAAYIVIQHLDPDHESLMVELLARRTDMAVHQAADDVSPEADNVYLIPPGMSLTIEDGRLRLEEFPMPRGVRRPIDTFFLSLADDIERGFACVVLSGTGSDGSRAFRAVKEAGGLCVVQTPETAKFDGMPRAAADTGFADFILPANEIAERVNTYFERLPEKPGLDRDVSQMMDDVCRAVRDATGHDFVGYKPATLVRRTRRRVQVTGADSPEAYLARLRSDPGEADALFREMLINVTEFFRDDAVYDRLRSQIVPGLVANASHERPLRIWVPGCSSGEEAYSIGMLIDEALRTRAITDKAFKRPQVHIFASDIDEAMLSIARDARYSVDAIETIPEPYRSQCVIAQEGRFVIAPHIRDMVRFSTHSVIKDPPFTRLDMVSCRNLLIYFGPELQEQVVPTFHYALRQGGILVLGTSEAIGQHASLFDPIDARCRIYKRMSGPGRMPPISKGKAGRPPAADWHAADWHQASTEEYLYGRAAPPRTITVAAQRILDRYAPAYLVVDKAGSLVTSSGGLTKYLEIPAGAVTADVVSLARPGLRAPVRRVLRRLDAGDPKAAVADVEVSSEMGVQTIDLSGETLPDGTRLLVIRDAGELRKQDQDLFEEVPNDTAEVEDELRSVRFRLRTTVEELEAANEELKSSNEEMMSMNEELQSANEELSTVNDELKTKMDEVAAVNADLRNFLESSDIPTVILGRDLEVRIYTPKAREIFPLRESDVGRALSEVRTPLDDAAMMDDAAKILAGAPPIEREVHTPHGERSYLMSITPYRAHNDDIDGVILSFADVTALKATQASLSVQKERLSLAMQAGSLGVWEFWPETGQVEMDAQCRDFFGQPPAPHPVTFADAAAVIDEDDLEEVKAAIERAVAASGEYEATFSVTRPDGSQIILYGIGRVHQSSPGAPIRMVGINADVTEDHAAAERSKLMVRELNHRVKNMLSVIAGMIRTSGRRADSVGDFVATCETRIAALSSAHTLLVKSDWQGAPLCDMVSSCLSIFDIEGRVEQDCEQIQLPAMESQAVSLILHELATNALKHGALSVPTGRVRVEARSVGRDAEGHERLMIAWTEMGGPPTEEPSQKGFGTILLRDMIRHQHRGVTEFDWRPEGLRYRVELDANRGSRAAS